MTSDNDVQTVDEGPDNVGPDTAQSRIKDLFAQASNLQIDRRDSFLQQQCGQDAQLRHEVESLLAADDQAGRFLACEVPEAQIDDAHLGQIIGRYRLLQKIGEGGFGTVYMAEQEHPVRRRVALKIIKDLATRHTTKTPSAKSRKNDGLSLQPTFSTSMIRVEAQAKHRRIRTGLARVAWLEDRLKTGPAPTDRRLRRK